MSESAPARKPQSDPLDGYVERLREQYPRAAHRGRLDQIEGAVTGLQHLVAQLPAEEEREADFEARCLDSLKTGNWKSTHPDHAHTYNDRADAIMQSLVQHQQSGAAR